MLNMDFSKRIVIDTAQQEWIASPSKVCGANLWNEKPKNQAYHQRR